MPRFPSDMSGNDKLKCIAIPTSAALALVAALSLFWLLGSSGKAATITTALTHPSDFTLIHYVAATGTDSGDCSTPVGACRTVQYALGQVGENDEVRIAAGVYTDLCAHHDQAQVAYITKTVYLQGGYSTTDWSTPDPVANITVLDAQRKGRVIVIDEPSVGTAISPTLEGLRITGAKMQDFYEGGGVYAPHSTVAISNCWVYSNDGGFTGGGISVGNGSTVINSIVSSNTATNGGGLAVDNATLINNIVRGNVGELGGGLVQIGGRAMLIGNTFVDNIGDFGGGLALGNSGPNTLTGNKIISNTALMGGGGIALHDTYAIFTNTVIADNRDNGNFAGGLVVWSASAYLVHSTIARNGGRAVYFEPFNDQYSTLVMANTILVSHSVGITATAGHTVTLNGVLWYNTPVTITQMADANVSVGNQTVGDPVFGPDGYHILAGSAAIDKGMPVGVNTDIDGDTRPDGCLPDLGADEYITGMECKRIYLPSVMRSD